MADNVRQRIIEAAGPIFAQKGFISTTVREICSKAEVNQAAINYYFGSKESLYKEVVAATFESMTPMADLVRQTGLAPSASFEQRLRECLVSRAREMSSGPTSPWKVQLSFREIRDPSPICADLLRDFIIKDYFTLYNVLDDCYDPSTPKEKRWYFVLFLLGTLVHFKMADWLIPVIVPEELRKDHFQPEQIADFAMDAFLTASAPYRRKMS